MDNNPVEEDEEGNKPDGEELKPMLPSRKPRLGQSSLAQVSVLPVMTSVQQVFVCVPHTSYSC